MSKAVCGEHTLPDESLLSVKGLRIVCVSTRRWGFTFRDLAVNLPCDEERDKENNNLRLPAVRLDASRASRYLQTEAYG